MRIPHFKREIAQLELSDLGCEWHVNMFHASRNPSVE